jgi:quercetin dioxygenase-like cupin family protein
MKVIKISDVPKQAASDPLFTGGPVSRQPLLTPETGRFFNMAVVNFSAGARNKLHTHTTDQVLLVTAGTGIVATEREERRVTVGDIIHAPAGERHWHGATRESAFSHIALTAAGSKTEQVEP